MTLDDLKPPKEQVANLKWRSALVSACRANQRLQDAAWTLCKRDSLWFINAFAWTYNPKFKACPVLPFITYPFQDEAVRDLEDCIEHGQDVSVLKSRDMGASWLILSLYYHQWAFLEDRTFLMVSRNEDYVDKPGNPKALFWKIDFLMERLPGWLVPVHRRTALRLSNMDNGCTIDGESTTGDVARGDRRTSILLDEFAAFAIADGFKALRATRDATDTRIFNSTPQGQGTAFDDVLDMEGVKHIEMHWSRHPVKSLGRYTDPAGKVRSPWYDEQCRRAVSDREIAQELDMDRKASSELFFDARRIEAYVKEFCRPHLWRGDLLHHEVTGAPDRLVENPDGPLLLWTQVNARGRIDTKGQRFAIGADISAGTGGRHGSNSVASICNVTLRTKIGELATPFLRPETFAVYCVALCMMLDGEEQTILAWEGAGPGLFFGKTVLELGWRRVWMRRTENRRTNEATESPGWWPTPTARRELYSTYRAGLFRRSFINPHELAVRECLSIVYAPDRSLANAYAISSEEVSGAKENHADRATADGIAWMTFAPKELTDAEMRTGVPDTIAVGSLAWRRDLRRRKRLALSSEERWNDAPLGREWSD